MKKLLALLLALTMVFALAACGKQANNPDEEQSNVSNPAVDQNVSEDATASELTVANSVQAVLDLKADTTRKTAASSGERADKIIVPNDEIADLLPYRNTSGSKNAICGEIYEPLFDIIDNELVGRLAKGYTDVDATHTQVELYDNIYDWDGNNITASDVVFSFELTKDSGYAEDFGYYASAKAISDYVVEFTWVEPITSLTAFNNMMNYVCIVSEKAYSENNFITDPVGTGPYTVKSFTVGVSVLLEVNDNYWQKDDLRSPKAAANVQEIQFDVLTDSTMQVIALEGGTLSYCEITSQDIDEYVNSGNYLVASLPNPFLTVLLANQSENSPCQDVNLRLAIYYGIDNSAIVSAIGEQAYYPASTCSATVYTDYQKAWENEENYNTVYNPELAKEYLEKSNYNGETLSILTNALEQNKNAATIIHGFLQQLGINAEINAVEPPAVNGIACDPTAWDLFISPANSTSGLTITRICNDFLPANVAYGMVKTFTDDDKLQDMLTECNSKDGYSIDLTNEILAYMNENVYTYGLFGNTRVYAFDPKLASFELWMNNTCFLWGACDYYLD